MLTTQSHYTEPLDERDEVVDLPGVLNVKLADLLPPQRDQVGAAPCGLAEVVRETADVRAFRTPDVVINQRTRT